MTQERAALVAAINAGSADALRAMDVFDRAEALEQLGMLAHEEHIGHPERPVEDWTPEELKAVVNLFKTWPREEAFEKKLQELPSHVAELYASALASRDPRTLDKKEKLTIAAHCFSTGCRDILGFYDFPEIELVFAPGTKPSYYGGLRPDGKIQICSRNLLRDSVEEGTVSGDLSFVELVLHEGTHLVQRYMADKSDHTTPDACTNMLAASNFYEATAALRKANSDIYFEHPFESQARQVAAAICEQIHARMPEPRGRGAS